jgi:hypothetical protein
MCGQSAMVLEVIIPIVANFKIGDEVEILISASDLYLYPDHIGVVADIIVDKNDNPVLAVIQIDENELDIWNEGIGFHDDGKRNISLDHIRLPK